MYNDSFGNRLRGTTSDPGPCLRDAVGQGSDRLRFASRSDALLINIAGHHLTSDRLTDMISTGGQTEAVRPFTVHIPV